MATENGHLNCLKYLHENGYSFHPDTYMRAKAKNQIECEKYFPRSIEACRREGILPKELIKKTKEQIKELFKNRKNPTNSTIEIFTKHLEDRRLEKIKLLLVEREIVMEEEQMGLWVPRGEDELSRNSGVKSNKESSMQVTMIEKEHRLLEQIKKRQEMELKKMLENEMKINENRMKNEMKMEKQKEREKIREDEIKKMRKQAEEKKKLLEEERRKKQEEEQAILISKQKEKFNQV